MIFSVRSELRVVVMVAELALLSSKARKVVHKMLSVLLFGLQAPVYPNGPV